MTNANDNAQNNKTLNSSVTNSNALSGNALAAMQLAQRQKEQKSKTELKPAYLNSVLNNQKPAAKDNSKAAAPTAIPTPSKAASKNTAAQNTAVQMVRVDISIAGTPHRIHCPSDESARLQQNANALNQALRDIRQQIPAKNPSNEELLVLHCLELYDVLDTLKSTIKQTQQDDAQNQALVDRLIQESRRLLGVPNA